MSLSTFQYGFDGPALDTTKFAASGAVTGVIDAGRFEITLANNTQHSCILESPTYGTLVGDATFCRMVGFRELSSGAEMQFELEAPVGTTGVNRIRWNINNGNIQGVVNNNSATNTNAFTIAYDPFVHAWFRMRESAGTIFWDTAPIIAANPPLAAEWVQRGSLATPAGFPIGNMRHRVRGGTFNATSGNPGMAYIDAINTTWSKKAGYGEFIYAGKTTTAAATANTGTTMTIALPTEAVAGDLLLMVIANKYDNPPVVPAGWTLVSSHKNTNAQVKGADAGPIGQFLYTKEMVSGETGPAISKTTETGTLMLGSIIALRKQTEGTWAFEFGKGEDNTGGGDWAITSDTALNMRGQDLIIACSAINGDISTADIHRLNIANSTIGGQIEIRDTGSANGDDGRQTIQLFFLTSNSNAAAETPGYTFVSTNNTVATTPTGPTILMRVRSTTPVAVNVTGTSATTEDSETNSTAGNVRVSGSISRTEGSETSTVTATARVSGTSATTEGTETSSAMGAALVSGSSATTEGAEATTASGSVADNSITGTIAHTEGTETSSASGDVRVSAASATAEGYEATAMSGLYGDITAGSIVYTEGVETHSLSANVKASATLSQTEGAETHSVTAAVIQPPTGTLSWIEGAERSSIEVKNGDGFTAEQLGGAAGTSWGWSRTGGHADVPGVEAVSGVGEVLAHGAINPEQYVVAYGVEATTEIGTVIGRAWRSGTVNGVATDSSAVGRVGATGQKWVYVHPAESDVGQITCSTAACVTVKGVEACFEAGDTYAWGIRNPSDEEIIQMFLRARQPIKPNVIW